MDDQIVGPLIDALKAHRERTLQTSEDGPRVSSGEHHEGSEPAPSYAHMISHQLVKGESGE